MHVLIQEQQGSPPYTWGAPQTAWLNFCSPGITPIYMGSTKIKRWPRQFVEDHPHIHGEHFFSVHTIIYMVGSPPYTWGAPQQQIDAITSLEDHPHIHGEHNDQVVSTINIKGSPPYTWGARQLPIGQVPAPGITPIYMGSTLKDPCNQAIFKSSKNLFQSVWS